MTAILRLQLDDKDPVRVNSAINQLAESYDRNGRTKLTANTTVYVSTSGSDSNSGSQTSPFLTIQHAYDVITNTLDLGGKNVTIQCASGTYAAGLAVSSPWTGGGVVILDLGGGTINTTANVLNIQATIPFAFVIQNGTLTGTSDCIVHNGTGILYLGTGLTFGASGGAHIMALGVGAAIQLLSPYTITGGAVYHYLAFKAGNTIEGNAITITLTGTPAFSSIFAYASRLGCIQITSATFAGTATGTRYAVDSNGVIYTGGGGANYFPGNVAGFSGTGGQYL